MKGETFMTLYAMAHAFREQVVKPLWMIDDKAAKPPPLWKRLSMVGAVFGMFAASYWYAPSGTTAKVGDATRYAHDQMLDLLVR